MKKANWKINILSYICLIKRNIVHGDSMEPLLKDGDIVFSKKAQNLRIGDIVIARHPFRKKEIIKQIASIESDQYELLGLNDDGSEDSRTFGMVDRKNIVRVVVRKK